MSDICEDLSLNDVNGGTEKPLCILIRMRGTSDVSTRDTSIKE